MSDYQDPIDLNSIQRTFDVRSFEAFVAIGFSFLWTGTAACVLFDVVKGFSLPEKWLLGIISVPILYMGVYFVGAYKNSTYRIANGELVHIGPTNRVKLRIPLNEIASIATDVLSNGGMVYRVQCRGTSFRFTNTVNGSEELSRLLESIAIQNSSVAWVEER